MTSIASEKARHGMVREALADVLIDRAAWAHGRLQAGRSHGVELHEETVTQDLLLDISSALPAMSVRTFTKRQEARSGADWQWEWWFGDQQWFGLRIQAKRLKQIRPHQLGYDLGYKVGRKRQRQVDLLLEDADIAGCQAAYVLYNGPELDISKFTWGCGRLPPSPAFFGISVLPGTVAQALVDARTVDLATVGARSRPWSCLASCDSSGCHRLWRSEKASLARPGSSREDLAQWAALGYFRLEMQAQDVEEPDAPDAEEGITAAPHLTREYPPVHVERLLTEGTLARSDLPPRVGALTVFLGPAANSFTRV